LGLSPWLRFSFHESQEGVAFGDGFRQRRGAVAELVELEYASRDVFKQDDFAVNAFFRAVRG
jgi:hypothetical protein